MAKYLFTFIILFFVFEPISALEKEDYGLFIKSAPYINTQRTGLVLENDSPIKLKNETTISFDMFIREDYVYGIVFRILTNKEENIDFILTVNDTKRHPLLVVKETAYTLPVDLVTEKWTPVSMTISTNKNEIQLTYGEDKLSVSHDLTKTSSAKVSFGFCPFGSFGSTDIASVNIKNIKVFSNSSLIRYWKLKEHQQTEVLDSIANVPAKVINPKWIIDINSTWEKIYSEKVPFMTQYTFDQKNKFYIVSPDSKNIRVFNTIDRTEEDIQVSGNGYIVATSPNMIFFDTLSKSIVTYGLDELLISEYSLETNTWSSQIKPTRDPYHNSSAIYFSSRYIYSFGGYGYHKYDHNLIRMNRYDGYQRKTELIDIPPRYSTSTAIVDSTIYIFGGRGSKSGRQEVSPRNYYDLYAVDLLMMQPVKLWEQEEVEKDFLPGENMIFDSDNNCFYVFTTQDGGTLIKIEAGIKGFERMSLPIGENLVSYYYLYSNLYFSLCQQKLYAIIYKQMTDTEVDVSIYSINYPPVPIADLRQITPVRNEFEVKNILFIGVAVVVALLIFIRKRRKNNRPTENETIRLESVEKPKMYYDFTKSAICFLNGFNVIDKKGTNITKQFTPTLKHLLILLILDTEKEEKGIFGKKLIQLLWFDKNEEAANNNRNVYLSKLRSVLENVGGVEIVSKNRYWTIELDQDITCDYMESMKLFRTLKHEQIKDPVLINKLLELLLRGVLLPNTEIDWLDNFKSDFSNLTVDMLTKLAQEGDCQLSDDLRLKVVNTIFLHDLVNEEALYIKCSILFNSGKKGLAQKVYNNFCKEYYNLLNINYKYSLTDIINRTNLSH